MIRHALMAASLLMLSGGAALAQDYPHEPPRGYMAAPPAEWQHRDDWKRMSERDRQAAWAERRHESWRCDHGDHGACAWLHDHG
jgi:hypothetical protein